MDPSCVQASRLYAHSLALPLTLCFVLAGYLKRCNGHLQEYCLMFEINLLWPSYGSSSRMTETCFTQHLYQQNSFAVKTVVHSGMAFLPGRLLNFECKRGARGVRRMALSHVLSFDRTPVILAFVQLPLYLAALTSERGDC
jgi:hypothetical protein